MSEETKPVENAESAKKFNRAAIIGAVAIGVLMVAMLALRTPFEKKRPLVGHQAPDVHLSDQSGKMVSLGDYKGKVVLVNFWAPWCPPCIEEMKWFEAAYQSYKDRGFVVIAISTIELTNEDMRAINVSFPVLKANARILEEYGGASDVPVSFLIGRDGKVARKVKRAYPEAMLRSDLDALLK